MKIRLIALALLATAICAPAGAAPAPKACDLRLFPEHWIDATEIVEKLRVKWATAAMEAGYGGEEAIAAAQNDARLCAATRDDIFPETAGGRGSQMMCEAILLCARFAAGAVWLSDE